MTEEYNFSAIVTAIDDLYQCSEDGYAAEFKISKTSIIIEELNRFFNGIKCNEFIITNNTDKLMFGMYIKPVWTSDEAILNACLRDPQDVITYTGDTKEVDKTPFTQYKVEVDSKLFEVLTPAEVVAVMVNDINELFTKSTTDNIRDVINAILAYRDETICEESVIDTLSLFAMCVEISMHNFTSCLVKDPNTNECMDPLIATTSFIKNIGLGYYFTCAIDKLYKSFMCSSLEVFNKAMILNWYIINYKRAKTDIAPVAFMRKAMDMEGSTLVKRSLLRVLETVSTVTEREHIYLLSLTEASASHKKGLLSQMKRNGLKSLEEDLYEYTMRLRNVETQDGAILLMRQLNSRMSILEDYLRYEEIDEGDRKRWEAVYAEYQRIRGELSKKTVYNRKMYGLFVDYNALSDMDKKDQNYILQSYY